MKLTIQEKRNIARYVIYSRNGMFLHEAISDNSVKSEIKLNLYFYNALKENFFKTEKYCINEDLLSALGGIKDLLTSTDVGQKMTGWIKNKLVPYFEKLLSGFVPNTIKNSAEYIGKLFADFIKWVHKTLSPQGLATLFARIKYKKFTSSPSTQEIECMMLAAKQIYTYILVVLVSAFIIKILGVSIDTVDIMTQKSLSGSLELLMTSLGLSKIFGAAFGTYGTITKAQKAKHLVDDIKKKKEEIGTETFNKWGDYWNYCDVKG